MCVLPISISKLVVPFTVIGAELAAKIPP